MLCVLCAVCCVVVLCRQVEEHMVNGKLMKLLVHRKGSTRAFPPHHPLIPVDYQLTGEAGLWISRHDSLPLWPTHWH